MLLVVVVVAWCSSGSVGEATSWLAQRARAHTVADQSTALQSPMPCHIHAICLACMPIHTWMLLGGFLTAHYSNARLLAQWCPPVCVAAPCTSIELHGTAPSCSAVCQCTTYSCLSWLCICICGPQSVGRQKAERRVQMSSGCVAVHAAAPCICSSVACPPSLCMCMCMCICAADRAVPVGAELRLLQRCTCSSSIYISITGCRQQ